MKLILLSLLAAIAAAVSAAAVAQSATTAQTVRVTESSYSIRLSAKPRPGVVKFVVRNVSDDVSDDAHDLWLRGGGKTWKTRVLGEGRTASFTATLKKGVRYSFWCAVGSHRSKGMRGSFIAR
ncbi:MAG: hypothetical protein ACRDNB_06085 [Gaiellaceae bacterium]